MTQEGDEVAVLSMNTGENPMDEWEARRDAKIRAREAIKAAGGVVTDVDDTADTGAEGGLGNTLPNPHPPPSGKRSRSWIITWNNPPDTPLTQLTQDFGGLEQWAGQLERGESGTVHYQFCMRYKNARTFKSIKEMLPACHIEACIDWKKSVEYCTKEDTRIDGPWASHDHLMPKKQWKWDVRERQFILKPWQIALESEIVENEPNPRTIIWYVDINGGAGKTEFCAYMAKKYVGVHIVAGSIRDIMYNITKKLSDSENEEYRCVFFDIPRAQGDMVSYKGIEAVKNGIITNTKYESTSMILNIPHVVVFSNSEPELTKLSHDRWDIRYLDASDIQTVLLD